MLDRVDTLALHADGVVIDAVGWDARMPYRYGASISLDPDHYDDPDPSYWCVATAEYAEGAYDVDRDGYDLGEDCDDGDEDVHPGAEETRTGVDDDCDGLVDELPRDGDLAIVEIMVDPEDCDDADCEWFELLNVSARDLDLEGLILDRGAEQHTIVGPLVVAPGDEVVLGLAPWVDYTYEHIVLANSTDDLAIRTDDATLDFAEWGPRSTLLWYTAGASMSLDPGRSTEGTTATSGALPPRSTT